MRVYRSYYPFLTLVAGAILPLAFAPVGLYFIAFFSPAILFYCWLSSTPKQGLWLGWLFGLGLFGVGASWIYVSLHYHGDMNIPLSLLVTLLFIGILASFTATQGYFFCFISQKKRRDFSKLCIFSSTFVIWEWFRSFIFTGFPWLNLGYTQIKSPLKGYAPLIGVYGVSLCVSFISGALLFIFLQKKISTKVSYAALIILIFILGIFLSPIHWTHATGKPLKVSLVQGNIPQYIKWDSDKLTHILNVYKEETEKNWDSNLIVWPEAAIPTFPQQIDFYLHVLSAQAKQHKTTLITGIPIYDEETKKAFNGLIILGQNQGIYLKRHLVPFGEYTPLASIFSWAMTYFNIPLSDLSPGPKKQPPLFVNNIPFSPFICYEITYPISVLNHAQHTQLIIVISDDSWFGHSFAASQQIQIAQMRALETGRYLLYATNTGITAIINPSGELQQTIPANRQKVLNGIVTAMKGKTPLMWWNYYPLLMIVIGFFLI